MTTEHPRRKRHRAQELEPRAERLYRRFKAGDKLAPFECCEIWQREGLEPELLPKWVVEHLAGIAADYYRDGPFNTFTPREYRELSSKERAKHEPDLNRVAGLSGTPGKPSAWLWRAEHDRDPSLVAYLDSLVARARADPDFRLPTADGREIRILDNHGRLRDEVRKETARAFRVQGPRSGWGNNQAKTVRRRVKALRGPDK